MKRTDAIKQNKNNLWNRRFINERVGCKKKYGFLYESERVITVSAFFMNNGFGHHAIHNGLFHANGIQSTNY